MCSFTFCTRSSKKYTMRSKCSGSHCLLSIVRMKGGTTSDRYEKVLRVSPSGWYHVLLI